VLASELRNQCRLRELKDTGCQSSINLLFELGLNRYLRIRSSNSKVRICDAQTGVRETLMPDPKTGQIINNDIARAFSREPRF